MGIGIRGLEGIWRDKVGLWVRNSSHLCSSFPKEAEKGWLIVDVLSRESQGKPIESGSLIKLKVACQYPKRNLDACPYVRACRYSETMYAEGGALFVPVQAGILWGPCICLLGFDDRLPSLRSGASC